MDYHAVNRTLTQVLAKQCFKKKMIMLIGPRQVGKTTLLKNLQKKLQVKSLWLNADEADVFEAINNAKTSTSLLQLIGKSTKLVIIDEAQQIPEIGLKLKLLYDNFPNMQIIATGSSAFDLQDVINEPLTGRKITYNLYPFSFKELEQHTSLTEAKRLLKARLVYGSYPDVINHMGDEKQVLMELTNSYLFKDLLSVEGIRKPEHIVKLVKALAFQIGNEVSFHELAKIVGIDTTTVEKYIGLLEKAFVVFRLPALSRNLRNEIKKSRKYYFYDNGIRNALINNFAPIEMRFDKGALWENFLINERMKINHYHFRYANVYFWRTKDQAEIDYIEEKDGYLHSFEFKWNTLKKSRLPKSFNEAYPQNTYKIVTKENYTDFIL